MYLFFLALAAGFLTILAPCILPVLPFLLGTSGGRSRWRPLMIVAGFVAAFSFIGAALATAGTFLGVSNDALRTAAGILLLLFGLALLFEGTYEKLSAKFGPALAGLGSRLSGGASLKTDAASGFVVGLSLGLIWSPCAGPILGTILTLAARMQDYLTTLLLMFAYAVGAGLPMLAIAYGSHRLQERLKRAGSAWKTLNRVLGAIVVLTAIGILTGYDRILVAWMLRYLPAPSTVLGL
jgi:cytochrome c biogenesis protein CcdA